MKLISKRRLVYLQGMQSYITKFINNNYQVCRILYRVINSGVGLPQLFSLPCSPLLWQRPWKPRGQWCSGAVKVPEDLLASLAGLGGLWLLPSEILPKQERRSGAGAPVVVFKEKGTFSWASKQKRCSWKWVSLLLGSRMTRCITPHFSQRKMGAGSCQHTWFSSRIFFSFF